MTQGIHGTIRKLTGNHMPRLDGPRRGDAVPLAVRVHVFHGVIDMHERPVVKHEQRVDVIHSDEAGQYRIELEPGVYTVVAEIDGRMYLNLFAGDGTWATVTVEPGEWVTFDIDDTSDATF